MGKRKLENVFLYIYFVGMFQTSDNRQESTEMDKRNKIQTKTCQTRCLFAVGGNQLAIINGQQTQEKWQIMLKFCKFSFAKSNTETGSRPPNTNDL